MWIEDYQWHYDYVRLAWDTGFSFDKWKSPNLDKNKICIADVDKIVRERDVASVNRYISTIVQYILDDEQAKVLDTNFVKIFRISQLAVEFLLFCKKYLDNTVVLLKKELTKNREENKELKVLVEDLQSHITALTRQQVFATFKCSVCFKIFSSEEYLNAHIKRRHSNQNTESYNTDADKLNMEIKQLKERLNNTEKLLKMKEEQSNADVLHNPDINDSKLSKVLEKFEDFKEKINSELRELKVQKSFYEENYGRLFEIVISNKENIIPKNNNSKEILKAETTTQTDKLLQKENVNNRNVLEIQEPCYTDDIQADSKVLHENHNSDETKECLEAKISSTLSGIEDQMQAFWNKLNEIEQAKSSKVFQPDSKILDQTENVNLEKAAKPMIKPRSKLSQPTHNTVKNIDNANNLKLEIDRLEQNIEQKIPQTAHQAIESRNIVPDQQISNRSNILSVKDDSNDTSTIEDDRVLESDESETQSNSSHHEEVVKPLSSTIGKQYLSPQKYSVNKEVFKNLSKEIQGIVTNRLQELGISESWSGLPQGSFEKNLEIINHQAALTKKTYSNFDVLKKKIIDDVEKECTRKTGSTRGKTLSKKQKVKKTQNVFKISYQLKSNRKPHDQRNLNISSGRNPIEIKNRSLYESDTESEKHFKSSNAKVVANMSQPQQMYSNVVNELKSLSGIKSHDDENIDKDDANKKEDTQKGVLKSFLSVGSLSKKKVLFNLDSDSSKIGDEPVIQKTGGSTTSIASSILECSVEGISDFGKLKVEVNKKNKDKNYRTTKVTELDDLSDLSLSDL